MVNVTTDNLGSKKVKAPPVESKVSRQQPNCDTIEVSDTVSTPIQIQQVGEGAFNIKGEYSEIFEAVKQTLTENGGTLKADDINSGKLEASWKYGINMFGLRVTARFISLPTGEIQVSIKGGFKDSLDTTGAGRKKALEISHSFLSKFPEQNIPVHQPHQILPPGIQMATLPQQSIPGLMNNTPHQGKRKGLACILTFLLGGIGVHKFYLGSHGWGVIYLLTSWTFIPSFVALIEGIVFLSMNEQNFDIKYNYTPPSAFKW